MTQCLHCVALMAFLGCLPGCSCFLGLFGKPKIETIRPRIVSLSFQGARVVFDMDVRNPYPFRVKAPLARYALEIQGKEFIRSEAPAAVDLPARGVGTVSAPVYLPYASLRAAYQGLSGAREVEYTLRGVVALRVLGVGVELPISYSDKLPVLRAPSFSDISLRLSDLSFTRAAITVEATLTNPNAFEIDIQGLGCKLQVDDLEVGGLRASTGGTIGPEKTGRLTLVGEVSAANAVLQLLRGRSLRKTTLVPTGSIKTPHGVVDFGQ